MRGMGEKRRVPNEKRFVAGILDEVKNFVHPLASDLESDIAVTTAALGIAVCHAVGEAAASVAPFPPLAALVAAVALCAEELC